jgi:lipid-A-disaccharide synthase-like uncharacterized protein
MPRTLTTAVAIIVLLCLSFSGLAAIDQDQPPRLNTDKRLNQLQVSKDQGQLMVRLEEKGPRLNAKEFLELLYAKQQQKETNFLFIIFNITSWINLLWVLLGIFGQVCFTGRMIVQWIISEKHQRSIVPVAFWWMSLGGASMLLLYFIWRKDIVGILGQSTGFVIYLRNLRLIYKEKRKSLTAS